MEYSIKDLETFTGIKAHTIRIWEKRYKILVPERTDTNIRHYSEQDLKYMMNIALLNNNGYKISKLAVHSPEQIAELVTKQFDGSSCSEDQTELLVQQLIDLDSTGFESNIDKLIEQFGLQAVVLKVITPFMQKVGWLWQAGSITPVHEHFASNIIRKKILNAINNEPADFIDEQKKYALFLPENEQHELGILFAYYLLHKRGHTVLYLGQNVPVPDLLKENAVGDTKVFVTAITTSVSYEKLLSRITQLALNIEPRPLFIKTHLFEDHRPRFPKNVKIIKSWMELLN